MSNDRCCLFVHNFAYFSLFFWKPVFSKIYLNKFNLHLLYMYLYLCVWINLYNNSKNEGSLKFTSIYNTSWMARRCPWKKNLKKVLRRKYWKKIEFLILFSGHTWVITQISATIGQDVWHAIHNIHLNVLFYLRLISIGYWFMVGWTILIHGFILHLF